MSSKTRGQRRSPSVTKTITPSGTQTATSGASSSSITTYTIRESAASTTSRARSPQSPTRQSRLQEKDELSTLNNRLAIYIETVRRLESENTRLQGLVLKYSESSTSEVSEIKALFQNELNDAKRLIDELAKEKAKTEINASKYRDELEQALAKLAGRERELKNLETRVKGLEIENQELRGRNEYLTNDNNRKTDENNNLKLQLADLEKRNAKLKLQLEEETLMRVDLENKNQTLKEELQFKAQLYEKELESLRSQKRIELQHVDTRLRDEYDSKLVIELQKLRDETEAKIAEMKDEVERRYHSKIADYEAQAKRNFTFGTGLREEIIRYKSRIDEQQQEITQLQNKIANMEAKLRDSEDKLRRLQAKYETEITAKDAEITELRKEIQEMLAEYQELYDVKIALDMEINAYRKLLESEEQRLKISGSSSSSFGASAGSSAGASYLTTSKKRRITAVDEEITGTNTNTCTQSAQTTCGIDIEEHDFDGKHVRLFNRTDKDIQIGGWQLKRLADGQETDYKFHKSLVIKAGARVTVWSSNAGVTHEPPNELVMNGQRWFVGEKMITVLLDKDGSEQSRRESQKLTSTIDRRIRSTPTKTLNTNTELRIISSSSAGTQSSNGQDQNSIQKFMNKVWPNNE